MKALSIVGNHPRTDKRVFDTDDEIWVFNARGTVHPRFDVLFQVHLPEVWRPLHGEWLYLNHTVPVYMLEKYPDVPMAIADPIRDAINLLSNVTHGIDKQEPLHYLPFSLTLAMALAVLQNRPLVKLWGIELHRSTEYWIQRNSYAFWTGFMAGKGIKLEIHGSKDIFNNSIYPLSISNYIEDRLKEEEPFSV
jgi:hypothetical protein